MAAASSGLFDALDKNGDGFVTREELEQWAQQSSLANFGQRKVAVTAPSSSWPRINVLPQGYTTVTSVDQQYLPPPRSPPVVVTTRTMPVPIEPERITKGHTLERRVVPPSEIISGTSVVMERALPAAPLVIERARAVEIDEGQVRFIVQRAVAEIEGQREKAMFEHMNATVLKFSDSLKDFAAGLVEERMQDVSKTFESWNTVLKGCQSKLDWQHAEIELLQRAQSPAAELNDELLQRLRAMENELLALRGQMQGAALHEHVEALSREVTFLGERRVLHEVNPLAPQPEVMLHAVEALSRRVDELEHKCTNSQMNYASLAREVEEHSRRHAEEARAPGISDYYQQEVSAAHTDAVEELREHVKSLGSEHSSKVEDVTIALQYLRDHLARVEDAQPEVWARVRHLEGRQTNMETVVNRLENELHPELGARMAILERSKADKEGVVHAEAFEEHARVTRSISVRFDGLHEQVQDHGKRVGGLHERVQDHAERFDGLHRQVEGHAMVVGRLDSVHQHAQGIEEFGERHADLAVRVEGLNEQVQSHADRFDSLHQQVQAHTRSIGDLHNIRDGPPSRGASVPTALLESSSVPPQLEERLPRERAAPPPQSVLLVEEDAEGTEGIWDSLFGSSGDYWKVGIPVQGENLSPQVERPPQSVRSARGSSSERKNLLGQCIVCK